MPSLNDKTGSLHPSAQRRGDGGDFDEGMSMPRPLRLLVRRFQRFVDRSRPMPAGIGSAIAILFLCGGLLSGAFVGGHGPVVLSGAAKAVGLKATDIVIIVVATTAAILIIIVIWSHDIPSHIQGAVSQPASLSLYGSPYRSEKHYYGGPV